MEESFRSSDVEPRSPLTGKLLHKLRGTSGDKLPVVTTEPLPTSPSPALRGSLIERRSPPAAPIPVSPTVEAVRHDTEAIRKGVNAETLKGLFSNARRVSGGGPFVPNNDGYCIILPPRPGSKEFPQGRYIDRWDAAMDILTSTLSHKFSTGNTSLLLLSAHPDNPEEVIGAYVMPSDDADTVGRNMAYTYGFRLPTESAKNLSHDPSAIDPFFAASDFARLFYEDGSSRRSGDIVIIDLIGREDKHGPIDISRLVDEYGEPASNPTTGYAHIVELFDRAPRHERNPIPSHLINPAL